MERVALAAARARALLLREAAAAETGETALDVRRRPLRDAGWTDAAIDRAVEALRAAARAITEGGEHDHAAGT